MNIKKDIKALQEMISYAEIHLPEKWLEEKWFVDGANAVKNIVRQANVSRSKSANN